LLLTRNDAIQLLFIDTVQSNVYYFELFKLSPKSLDSFYIFLVLVESSDDLIFPFLDSSLDFGLKLILGEGPADVCIVFEAEKGSRIHGHKTFEKLLVAIKELGVNFNVVAPLDFLQVFKEV